MNTILKHLKIEQVCTTCKKKLYFGRLIASVPQEFSITDLTTQVKKELPKVVCKKHPEATTVASYTFYHEVIL